MHAQGVEGVELEPAQAQLAAGIGALFADRNAVVVELEVGEGRPVVAEDAAIRSPIRGIFVSCCADAE